MDATDGVSLAAYDHRRRVSGKKRGVSVKLKEKSGN
jgi:hypothetical protein